MGKGSVRMAWESVVGNEANSPTLATKKLFAPILDFGWDVGAAPLSRDDELVNSNEPRPVFPEMFSPTWSMSVRMYPDVLAYLLTIMLGAPTTTQGDGAAVVDLASVAIPSSGYRHVWTSPYGTSNTPRSAQLDVVYTGESAYFKVKGALIDTLTIETPDQGGAIVNVSGPALYIASQSDPSLSPAFEAESIRPFLRPHAGLTWGLSSTATTRDLQLQQVNPVELIHSYGSGSKFADLAYRGEGVPVTSGTIGKVLVDNDDFNGLVANTGFAALASWVNESIIGSSYPYKVFCSLENAQYVGGTADNLANAIRRGASWEFTGTKSTTAAAVWQVVNATSSYA